MRAVFAIAVCALVVAACDGSPYPTSPAPRNPVVSFGTVTAASVTASLQGCSLSSVPPDLTLLVSARRERLCRHRDHSRDRRFERRTVDHVSAPASFAVRCDARGRQRPFLYPASGVWCGLASGALLADVTIVDASGVPTTSAVVSQP